MPSMLVTCPESAHLEHIEFVRSPLGMLIRRCSALRSGCGNCPRTCAARLDRKLGRPALLVGTVIDASSCLREK